MTEEYVDLLFTTAPHADGEFIEAEDPTGRSLRVGEWIPPAVGDLYWRLRIPTRYSLVMVEVAAERAHQTAKGYTSEHDDGHHFGDLVEFAEQRLMNYVDNGWDQPDRHMLVEAAALIVAAIERLDRS